MPTGALHAYMNQEGRCQPGCSTTGHLIVNPRQFVKWGYTEMHPLFKRNR